MTAANFNIVYNYASAVLCEWKITNVQPIATTIQFFITFKSILTNVALMLDFRKVLRKNFPAIRFDPCVMYS